MVAVETLLEMALLFVAPFLHGSARNQAHQADLAKHSAVPLDHLPRLRAKEAGASTWVLGTIETIAVIAIMVAGYWVSGLLARRRAAATVPATDAGDLVDV